MTVQVTAGCVEDFMFDKINCIFFVLIFVIEGCL